MTETGLQDGMLVHYQEQAKSADANVEERIEREPFDFRDIWHPELMARSDLFAFLRAHGMHLSPDISNDALRTMIKRVRK